MSEAPAEWVCDLSRVEPGLEAVELLCRLRLLAARLGHDVAFRRASPELVELVDLVGLRDVLRLELGVQPVGQPEQGEPACGVEERRVRHDPPV